MKDICKIRDLYRLIYDFEMQFEKKHQISLNEGMLLCTLHQNGSLSSGQISEALRLTTSNTSKVIKSLETKGYLIREVGEVDKRQMNFSLTPAGAEKIKDIKSKPCEIPDSLNQIIALF